MAVKAKDSITVYHVIDIDSTTWYYNLQPSTATPPAKPTTDPPPSPWVTTEPTYTEGATNSLYVVEKTVFSDGSFEYTDVSLSSSYEAAKTAYNKSVVALNTAVSSATTATKYIVDVTNGVFVHADGTPDDPTNANAKGVLIQDDVRIIIGGTAVAKYGSSIEIGTNANTKITIDGTNGLKIGNKIQLDTSGNASFTGKITSTSGNIGGWDISNFQIVYKTQITVDSTVYDSQVYMRAKGGSDGSAATASTHAFGVQHKLPSETNWTNDFVVRHDGYMYARNANVSGQITAISGKIGEFTLSNGTLSHTSGNYTITLRNVQTGNPEYGVFYITDSSATDRHPFRINGDGSIKATKGTIGGWTITATSLKGEHNNKGTGFQIPSSGTWAIAVGYNTTTPASGWSTAPFRVNHSGQMWATDAHITGTITGSAGEFTQSFKTNIEYTPKQEDGTDLPARIGFLEVIGGKLGLGNNGIHMGVNLKSGGSRRAYVYISDWIDIYSYGSMAIQSSGSIDLTVGSGSRIYLQGTTDVTGSVLASSAFGSGGKTAWNDTENSGTWITSNGAIHMTQDSTHGGTIGFHYNFSANATSSLVETASGHIKLTGELEVSEEITSKTYNGYSRIPVGSQSDNGQRVGMIRCTSTSQAGIASQNGTAGSSYAWRNFSVSSSDIRLKKNVEDCEIISAIEAVNKIRMRSFDWVDHDEHQKIGMIADELELIDPRLSIGGGQEKDGTINYKSVDTFYLVGYLVKAIQELSKELKVLKGEVA